MNLFRPLTPAEEQVFRQWARDNYAPYSAIEGTWHPVVQDECRLLNMLASAPEGEYTREEIEALYREIRDASDDDPGKQNEPPTYCTQNAGDCSICSLVNYGRDCQNNPVEIRDTALTHNFEDVEEGE